VTALTGRTWRLPNILQYRVSELGVVVTLRVVAAHLLQPLDVGCFALPLRVVSVRTLRRCSMGRSLMNHVNHFNVVLLEDKSVDREFEVVGHRGVSSKHNMMIGW
jgi:hypothetical protein